MRKKSARKTPWVPGRFKKFIMGNLVTLIGIALTVLVSFTIYYLAYAQPELRIIGLKYGRQFDKTVKENGDFTYYNSMLFTVKNFSFKRGYVSRIEFIPTT